MRLYHGTNVDFSDISLEKSQTGKDFGCGFYLSADREQAMKQAQYRSMLMGGSPVVLEYEFNDSALDNCGLQYKHFDAYTKDWAEFIFANRMNCSRTNIHDYDIVYGPIANDKVGVQVRNLMEENITLEVFLERLKYIKGITFQYFFGTENAIGYLSRI